MKRGEIWWASLPKPKGSGPGYRRPVLIVQANEFNNSAINTVIAVAITSNLRLASAPGNLSLSRAKTGLDKDSIANVSQIITLDKSYLLHKTGQLDRSLLNQLDDGLSLVLGLQPA